MASFDYDVIVIAPLRCSVAALRATEKGYRVGVMEAGRRWKDETFRRPTGISSTTCGSCSRKMYGIQGSSTGRCAHPFVVQAWAAVRT